MTVDQLLQRIREITEVPGGFPTDSAPVQVLVHRRSDDGQEHEEFMFEIDDVDEVGTRYTHAPGDYETGPEEGLRLVIYLSD